MVLLASLYNIARNQSGRAAGLLAVGLLVSSASFLQLSVSVMIELPAMALALAAVWALTNYFAGKGKKWLILSGMLFGCALQVKLTAAIFLPAVAVAYLAKPIRRWRRQERGQPPPREVGKEMGGNGSPRKDPGELQSIARRPWQGIRRSFHEAAVWGVAALAVFGVIMVVFCGSDAVSTIWRSHFSDATLSAVTGKNYAFQPESLLNDLALLVPAAVGVALIGWKRRLDLSFPVALLGTALAVHLWHRPYWYYYALHFALPMAWLGAIGIVEWFRAIWRQDIWASLPAKLRLGMGWMGWSLVVSLALTLAPEKAWNAVTRLSAAPPAMEDPNVNALRKHAAQTHWVFADRVIYAFWAGLPVPPELAVIPSKRVWSGQINEIETLDCLERYQPEQILLLSGWGDKPRLSNYIHAHYRTDADSGSVLYLRK
jgi:hypothetical protein